MHRVVDRDRAGRKTVHTVMSIAPGLRAGPSKEFGNVRLVARPYGAPGAGAQSRAARVHEHVVVGAAEIRDAVAAVGAELDDGGTRAELAVLVRHAAQNRMQGCAVAGLELH